MVRETHYISKNTLREAKLLMHKHKKVAAKFKFSQGPLFPLAAAMLIGRTSLAGLVASGDLTVALVRCDSACSARRAVSMLLV